MRSILIWKKYLNQHSSIWKKKIFSLANTFEFLDFNLRRDWLLDITSIGIWVLVYVTSEVNIYNTLSCLIDAFSHQLEGLV